jgi:hypothetical protein
MSIYGVQNILGNQYGRVYNKSTHETLRIEGASVFFADDFLGKYENVYIAADNSAGPWIEKLTGAAPPTIVMLDSIGGGALSFNLTADEQKQEAGIYFNNYKNFNIDKGVIFEARVAVHTAPTAQSELYFGVANDYVEGPIAEADAGPTVHALFCYDGALTPTIHTDDATTDTDAVATSVTSVLDTYAIFRIDASVPASAKFYINGVRVGSSSTFDLSAGANVVVQPFIMAHKEAGVGVGSMYLDYVKMWQLSR